MLITEMPEIGTITGEEAVRYHPELAPGRRHDSRNSSRGNGPSAGVSLRALRHVMFQSSPLVAANITAQA